MQCHFRIQQPRFTSKRFHPMNQNISLASVSFVNEYGCRLQQFHSTIQIQACVSSQGGGESSSSKMLRNTRFTVTNITTVLLVIHQDATKPYERWNHHLVLGQLLGEDCDLQKEKQTLLFTNNYCFMKRLRKIRSFLCYPQLLTLRSLVTASWSWEILSSYCDFIRLASASSRKRSSFRALVSLMAIWVSISSSKSKSCASLFSLDLTIKSKGMRVYFFLSTCLS